MCVRQISHWAPTTGGILAHAVVVHLADGWLAVVQYMSLRECVTRLNLHYLSNVPNGESVGRREEKPDEMIGAACWPRWFHLVRLLKVFLVVCRVYRIILGEENVHNDVCTSETLFLFILQGFHSIQLSLSCLQNSLLPLVLSCLRYFLR